MESTTPPPPPRPETPEAAVVASDSPVPQVRPGSGPPSVPYAAVLEVDRQEEYSRWLPLVKWLLAIPHWFVLVFIWFAAAFALIGSWFAVLFTGKYPAGVHKFIVGTSRWTYRVSAYGLLMTDTYPPFSMDDDPNYPVRYDVAYQEKIANWRPLVSWLLVFPYAIVAGVLLYVAYLISFIAFFAILFTKKFPQGLFDFNLIAMRWQARANAYSYWMTERYPPWDWS